jgi:hypothetical protein
LRAVQRVRQGRNFWQEALCDPAEADRVVLRIVKDIFS